MEHLSSLRYVVTELAVIIMERRRKKRTRK
jgi:hypothetical protein